MKKLLSIICISAAIMLVQSTAFAQPNHSLTFRSLWNNYTNPQPAWEDWENVFHDANDRGVEIAYGRRLHKGTWLMVPGKIGTAQYPRSLRKGMIANLDLLLHQNLFSRESLLNPSIHAGIGSTWDFRPERFDFNIPFGAGLNIRLGKNFFLNAQTQFRASLENRPAWHHGIGMVVYFGEPDRDGDGVSDKEDRCPDVAGLKTLMGCPDRDSDGLADDQDKCPDIAGLVNLMGCPDRDGDGVADGDDKCPNLAGPAATMGCPDRDSDGVMDVDDECPDVAGLASMKGCPDSDGDGITDASDKCPNLAGPAATMGCPDRDGDGIMDTDDKCPADKGLASTFGCPDRDGDGVADIDDACPDKRGDAAHKGCPDTDGDGIFDDIDRCPEKRGVASLRGCPEIKKEDKAKLERAIKRVQFETGKSILLRNSFAVLDEVVNVMNTYPEYSLKLSGHTDNVGGTEMNHDLSHRRAKACYDYLVNKGIAANRVESKGFGETQPRADNNTAAGRTLNRRVMFELYVK
ncbi:MAG: OmpA family protein [Saprospiraceae bacterium]|nr:OmpA family protein [Saprospiraceae bacterium]